MRNRGGDNASPSPKENDRSQYDSDRRYSILSSFASIIQSKRRVVFVGIILFSLLLLFRSWSALWREQNYESYYQSMSPYLKDKVTVVLNTYQRNEQLLEAIAHYSECPVVKFIHVAWSETNSKPPFARPLELRTKSPRVVFDVYEENSLNNRFQPLGESARTESIFAVDDDIRISCAGLSLFYYFVNQSPSLFSFM